MLPTFGWVVAARFVAALPHGAYFGTASLVAGRILGPGSQAQGIAFVLSGLTVANVVGVPLITRVGQLAGWRAAYLVVAGAVPAHPAGGLAGGPAAARDPSVPRSAASSASCAARSSG